MDDNNFSDVVLRPGKLIIFVWKNLYLKKNDSFLNLRGHHYFFFLIQLKKRKVITFFFFVVVTEKPQQRRGSVGSLDSGMSISFQSTSASTVSRDSSPQNLQVLGGGVGGVGPGGFKNTKMMNHQQSFLGGIFAKRERKSSRAGQEECFTRTTEV